MATKNEFDPVNEQGQHCKDCEWWQASQESLSLCLTHARKLTDVLEEIDNWARAYSIDVFPEPDMKMVHEVLQAAGLSLDAVSASNMRYALNGVGEIARKALEEKNTDQTYVPPTPGV